MLLCLHKVVSVCRCVYVQYASIVRVSSVDVGVSMLLFFHVYICVHNLQMNLAHKIRIVEIKVIVNCHR